MFRRAFKFFMLSSALCIGAVLAVATFHETVQGSGVPATEDRSIEPVTQVALCDGGNLTLLQGDVPSLTVSADDNLLPFIETESSGNKLSIRTKSGYSLNSKTPITFRLVLPHVEKLSISGSGNAKVENRKEDTLAIRLSGSGNAAVRDLNCQEFSVTISGSGTAAATGKANKVTTKISGSGDIDASALQATTAQVRVSGSGNAAVWATSELQIRVSGSGDVKYKGSPKLDQKLSGSGKIHAISE